MQASVDEFIQKEKSVSLPSAMTERVMKAVNETELCSHNIRSDRRIQTLAVAASITLALILGISLGKSYRVPEQTTITWNIDDNGLENLDLYKDIHE